MVQPIHHHRKETSVEQINQTKTTYFFSEIIKRKFGIPAINVDGRFGPPLRCVSLVFGCCAVFINKNGVWEQRIPRDFFILLPSRYCCSNILDVACMYKYKWAMGCLTRRHTSKSYCLWNALCLTRNISFFLSARWIEFYYRFSPFISSSLRQSDICTISSGVGAEASEPQIQLHQRLILTIIRWLEHIVNNRKKRHNVKLLFQVVRENQLAEKWTMVSVTVSSGIIFLFFSIHSKRKEEVDRWTRQSGHHKQFIAMIGQIREGSTNLP